MLTIDHIGVGVASLDSAEAWCVHAYGWRNLYRHQPTVVDSRALGLGDAPALVQGATFLAGDTVVRLHQYLTPTGAVTRREPWDLGYSHIAVSTDSIGYDVARLAHLGVKWSSEPNVATVAPHAGRHWVHGKDPVSTRVELIHDPGAPVRETFSVVEPLPLDHVGLVVPDLAAAVKWYVQAFRWRAVHHGEPADVEGHTIGLPGRSVRLRSALLAAGGCQVQLHEYLTPGGNPIVRRPCDTGVSHIAIGTDAINDDSDRLRSLGVKWCTDSPQNSPSPCGAHHWLWGRDPWGNTLELVQERPRIVRPRQCGPGE